jgi:uncharacterized protein (DUF305 family)
VVFVASFFAMRTQCVVSDQQLLRSVIPHHSGAILMCEQSLLSDAEIVSLCEQIIRSQWAEIAQLEQRLVRSWTLGRSGVQSIGYAALI